MSEAEIPADIALEFEQIVSMYRDDVEEYERIAVGLSELFSNKRLRPLIHSLKSRVKDPEHLAEKLNRKYRDAVSKGESFEITTENAYEKINDLVGVRILHLHTKQFGEINRVILDLLGEEYYEVVEGPSARYWDNEYKEYFESIPIKVEANPRLYTSVHYIIKPNWRTSRTGEIQVRTLAEELWGEVDHSINYPHQATDIALREQLLVLARVTSSCTRLVDSIFKCLDERNARKAG